MQDTKINLVESSKPNRRLKDCECTILDQRSNLSISIMIHDNNCIDKFRPESVQISVRSRRVPQLASCLRSLRSSNLGASTENFTELASQNGKIEMSSQWHCRSRAFSNHYLYEFPLTTCLGRLGHHLYPDEVHRFSGLNETGHANDPTKSRRSDLDVATLFEGDRRARS